MAALKKGSFLLAVALLAMIGSGTAQAQQELLTCTATAVPPIVRAEGIAELVGDIVLTCTAAVLPGAPITGTPDGYLRSNVSVSLNVNVTNNINFGAGANITDSVLIVNENNCTTPSPSAVFTACTGSFANPAPLEPYVQDPMFGSRVAVNRIEWNGVFIPFPGDTGVGAAAAFPPVTTLRVTSMRANASQLGVPDSATFPSTQVRAFVSITGPTVLPVTNNELNVAVPILGLTTEIRGGTFSGLQCVVTGLGSFDADGSLIRVREGFATAFKTLGVPTFTPGNIQWEDGYYAPGSGVNGGGATQGTRLMVRFFNIPEGVELRAPSYIDNGDNTITQDRIALALVSGTDANGAGGTVNTDPTGQTPFTGFTFSDDVLRLNDDDDFDDLEEITFSGGFAAIVYEVVDGDPFATEFCDIPIFFRSTPDTENDLPAVGTGQIQVSFAPLSTVLVSNLGAPEPRFADTGDPTNVIDVVRCTSTLLFPFVTNQAGFDTGIAISNTSRDWLGTSPQSGACTLHYHGSTTGGGAAPADQTSTVINAGEQLLFTLSGGRSDMGIEGGAEFQGYLIAVCDFQFAHGYAFITDGFGGIPALAQGYLALIVDRDVTGRFVDSAGGESLGH